MNARERLREFKDGGQQSPAQRPQAPSSPPPTPAPQREEAIPQSQGIEGLEPPRQLNANGQEIYEAFKLSPWREDHLEIRLASKAWPAPRFFDLLRIVLNQRLGTEIVLLFPEFGVYINGKNLAPVYYAIKAHRCGFVEAYHPEKFAPVEDENAPFVSSIELRKRGSEEEKKLDEEQKGSDAH